MGFQSPAGVLRNSERHRCRGLRPAGQRSVLLRRGGRAIFVSIGPKSRSAAVVASAKIVGQASSREKSECNACRELYGARACAFSGLQTWENPEASRVHRHIWRFVIFVIEEVGNLRAELEF